MVAFRSWMESRCLAMQLSLCLLVGLRLVSASIQGSTCALRLQRLPPSSQQSSPDQHHIPTPTKNWAFNSSKGLSKEPNFERQDGETEQASEEERQVNPLSVEKRACQLKGDNKDDDRAGSRPTCPRSIADDFKSDTRTKAHPLISFKERQFESMNLSSSTPPLSSSSPSSSQYSSADFESDPTSSVGSSSSDSGTLSSPNNDNSMASSSPSATSSSTLSSSSSSSPNQDSPTPLRGTLPKIDFGTSKDSQSNLNQNQDSINSTSNGSTDQQSNQSQQSQQRTTSIITGVTVPVGVIALGLVALVVLHKQRQKKKKLQVGYSVQGQKDEEMADKPATQLNTPNPTPEVKPIAALGVRSSHSHPEPRPQDQEQLQPLRSSFQTSDASHSTARSDSTRPVAATTLQVPSAGDPRTDSSHDTPGVAFQRARSLKRKPVPAFLETNETTAMAQDSLDVREETPTAASLPFPRTATATAREAAPGVDHSPPDPF